MLGSGDTSNFFKSAHKSNKNSIVIDPILDDLNADQNFVVELGN